MAISREKEQAEQGMYGVVGRWTNFVDITTQLNAMTNAQWDAVWDQVQSAWTAGGQTPPLGEITRAQAITFVTNRRDELFVELAIQMNIWRLTP